MNLLYLKGIRSFRFCLIYKMALDGIFLSALAKEFNDDLQGAKVEKINQPERDEIVISLHAPARQKNKHVKLVISVDPAHPVIYLSENAGKENPIVAPNFCMLLRKHLSSSRITGVRQAGLDRVIIIDFESRTEMYETVERRIIVEIMGRFSNTIFTDGNGVIYDAIKQVDFSVSSKRQFLPQLEYELPQAQERKDIRTDPLFLPDFSSEERADKVLNFYFTGFSSLISREAIYYATKTTDKRLCDFSDGEKEKLQSFLTTLSENIKGGNYKCVTVTAEKPVDFYCFPISQYGNIAEVTEYGSPSETVEAFFAEKMKSEHIRRHSSDLMRAVNTLISRVARKISARKSELENCRKADEYKLYGDVLFSNIAAVPPKASSARLPDYYSEDMHEITVPLDPSLSATRNAQRYYKLYKKLKTAEDMLSREIPAAENELEYLESVKTSLITAENVSDLREVKEELIKEGYIRKPTNGKNIKKQKSAFNPAEFETSEGIPVLVGKNNTQNDLLTTKFADKHDIWFHVKNYPGSHTVLLCSGREYTNISLNEAAIIAATFSSIAENGGKVEVDYIEVGSVKKPNGAKPGMVVYEGYQTAVVTPDKALAEKLRKKH